MGTQEADGSMDSKWAALLLLLLLLLNWGHTEEAGSWGEDQVFAVSEHPAAPSTQPPSLLQLKLMIQGLVFPRLLRSSKSLASKGGKWLLSPRKFPLEAILSLHVFSVQDTARFLPCHSLITGRR